VIGTAGTGTVVGLSLVFLFFFLLKGRAAARSVPLAAEIMVPDDTNEFPDCPREFVARVFSRDDWRYISDMKSPPLEKLFHSERKAVALLWVQQTSAAIQRAMHEHKLVARSSEDLEFTTELKLLLLYSQLMCICGLLSVAIQSVGPLWIRNLAVYAEAHAQRLVRVQQSIQAAASPREVRRVGAA